MQYYSRHKKQKEKSKQMWEVIFSYKIQRENENEEWRKEKLNEKVVGNIGQKLGDGNLLKWHSRIFFF